MPVRERLVRANIRPDPERPVRRLAPDLKSRREPIIAPTLDRPKTRVFTGPSAFGYISVGW